MTIRLRSRSSKCSKRGARLCQFRECRNSIGCKTQRPSPTPTPTSCPLPSFVFLWESNGSFRAVHKKKRCSSEFRTPRFLYSELQQAVVWLVGRALTVTVYVGSSKCYETGGGGEGGLKERRQDQASKASRKIESRENRDEVTVRREDTNPETEAAPEETYAFHLLD